MATYKKRLKDKSGNIIHPVTSVSADEINWSSVIDKIYPVGSFYTSNTLSTASQVGATLGGTWDRISADDEISEVEVLRWYNSQASMTSTSLPFSTINWSDDIEVRIQLESTGAGGVGIRFNNSTAAERTSLVGRGDTGAISITKGNNDWQTYCQLPNANTSLLIIGRTIYTTENTLNWRRWGWTSFSPNENRMVASSFTNVSNINSIQVVAENGANLNRCFISIVAKRRLGKVYRYERTA